MNMSDQVSSNMNDFLQSLGADSHSEGQFSVNVDKALHKVETFTLPDPGLFIVELLAFAVAGSATSFKVSDEDGTCRIEFDGESLSSEELEDPISPLFGSQKEARRLHFALALTGAKQLAPNDVVYHGLHGGLRLEDDRWIPTEDQGPEQVFLIGRPFRLLGERLKKKPTLQEVLEVCHLSPPRMEVNGKLVLFRNYHPPVYGKRLAGQLTLQGPEKLPCYRADEGFRKTVEAVDDFSATFYFCQANKARRAGVSVLRHGVSYRLKADLGPGVCGLIVCSDLRRNLSGTGVVEDSHLRAILKRCHQEIEDYLLDLLESPYRMRGATLKLRPLIRTLQASEQLGNWEEAADKLEEPLDLDEQLKEFWSLRDEGRERESEGVALSMLNKMVSQLDDGYYDREGVFQKAAAQEWLDQVTIQQPNLNKARDLVGISRSLIDSELFKEEFLEPVSLHLMYRRDGHFEESLTHLPDQQETMAFRVETFLALGRLKEAESLCLAILKAKSPEAVEAPGYGDSPDVHTLLAYILDLTGRKMESLSVKSQLLEFSYCSMTRHLRYEEWVNQHRGAVPFVTWLKLRTIASGKAAWLTLSFNRHYLPRGLNQAIKGRAPQDLETPLRQYFDNEGAIYKHSFEQVTHLVCQSLRLAGDFTRADRLLATSHLLVRATRLREELSDGKID